MKIGIITFHFVNNFGGGLQAYALQRVIRNKFEAEAEIINYQNWFIKFTDFVRIFPITRNKSAILSGMRTFSERFERKRQFANFLNTNFNISKKYKSYFELKNNPPKYDKYICGSDQIWNPYITCGVARPYWLSFVKEGGDKCAYAPSLGTGSIANYYIKQMKREIQKIDYLSIRESQSANQIKEWIGREAEVLIDPTFLLGKAEWREVADYDIKTPEHYILVYIMQSDYCVYDYVKQIKEQYKLPVVDISRYGYNPGFVDASIIGIGPAQFLGLFDKADIVCTNSYHGLVFSLIFGKKLYLIPSKTFGLRMVNLLKLLQIDQSKMINSNDIEELEYDVTKVERAIKDEREKAFAFLRGFIEER